MVGIDIRFIWYAFYFISMFIWSIELNNVTFKEAFNDVYLSVIHHLILN